jgi:hypothetical protein
LDTPPGTKVVLQDAKFAHGFIILDKESDKTMKVLGGSVEGLLEGWKVQRVKIRIM